LYKKMYVSKFLIRCSWRHRPSGGPASEMPKRKYEAEKKILAFLIFLPPDDEASITFGVLSARLWSEGKRIGDFDEVIAAIALARDREIVKRNVHFREVTGPVVVGW
jgi:predicted nucleic acid-binding protein